MSRCKEAFLKKLTWGVMILLLVLLGPVICAADIVEFPKCNARISGDLNGVRVQDKSDEQGESPQYFAHIGKGVAVHVMRIDFPAELLKGESSDDILDFMVHIVMKTMSKGADGNIDILSIEPTSYNDLPGRIVTMDMAKVGYVQKTKAFLKDHRSIIAATLVGPTGKVGKRENLIFESFAFW